MQDPHASSRPSHDLVQLLPDAAAKQQTACVMRHPAWASPLQQVGPPVEHPLIRCMEALARAIEAQAARAPAAFYRLVLVVGPPGAGKTAALRALQRKQGWPLLNLNAELSEQLLELSSGQRRLKAAQLVDELVAGQDAEVTLLDNIGILFHPALQQDPLRVLQRAARNRTVVATWQGEVADKTLTYAVPDHPEFRRHQNPEVLLVRTSAPDDSIEVAG